jgi:hypothetical protein
MIHGFPSLGNATEVSDGIYYGGSDEAMELMANGQANPGEFRFFFKYTAWLPGEILLITYSKNHEKRVCVCLRVVGTCVFDAGAGEWGTETNRHMTHVCTTRIEFASRMEYKNLALLGCFLHYHHHNNA